MSLYRGKNLSLEIFGASHAPELGMRLHGFPAGEAVELPELTAFLDRRRPGKSDLQSSRSEPDEPVFRSGLSGGVTDGTELCAVIKNTDVRREDYTGHVPRPGHADFAAWKKYGLKHDMSGGGEFSGRMTAPLCVAGGICLQYLARRGITVAACMAKIAGATENFEEEIRNAALCGDSVGGIVECIVTGLPAGLGAELFGGLESGISALCFAVPAVKGIEFGAGFAAAEMRGSEHNDAFCLSDGRIVTETNHHGGILGGISTGMPLTFHVAIKPTPSIKKPQKSVDMDTMREVNLSVGGRHDPCIVPRAVPVIEAACAIALTDELLSGERADDLAALRRKIDRTDAELVKLLTERFAICGKIGQYKKENALPVYDPVREEEKLAALGAAAGEYTEEIKELYGKIFEISRNLQEKP